MTNSWEGFLDIIGLERNIRQKADLEILMNFPNGQTEKSQLLRLFDQIENIYKKNCTILWWNNSKHIYSRMISKEDLIFLQYLWDRKAGNYLLFLPEEFDIERTYIEDDEEFIGMCLKRYSHLILKTEDVYVALHLYLNE